MTQRDETISRIQEFVLDAFPLAKQKMIGPEDSLFDAGIIDSMGTLEIIQFLEDEFGIEVSDEEMVDDHFESIHRITQLVKTRTAVGGVED